MGRAKNGEFENKLKQIIFYLNERNRLGEVPFTEKQRYVTTLIIKNKTFKEISSELGISYTAIRDTARFIHNKILITYPGLTDTEDVDLYNLLIDDSFSLYYKYKRNTITKKHRKLLLNILELITN